MVDSMVSVIIPYYNAGAFIAGALESIRAQGYAHLEIIIIDDGSSDDIAQRVRWFGDDVIFISQENRGPAAARNAGIKAARGDIIAFLDADDRWTANKLRLQVGRLNAEPDLGIVTGRIQYVRLPGAEDLPIRLDENNTLVHVHLGAALVRKEVFDIVGLFDERLRFSEDHDWFLRVRESRVKMAILKDITLIYQRHAGNMTRKKNIRDLGVMDVLRRSIERRKLIHNGKPENLALISEYDDAQ